MKLPPVQTARRCETEITYPYELQCSICTFFRLSIPQTVHKTLRA